MTATTALRLDRDTVLHLASDLSIVPVSVEQSYWDHRAGNPELDDGRILSVFDYEATWTWWERHPLGTELVHVIAGEVAFHLDDETGRRQLDLREGDSGLVPQGAWHRAEIHRPTRLLFVTPTPARTEHRDA